jgi:cytochrome c553
VLVASLAASGPAAPPGVPAGDDPGPPDWACPVPSAQRAPPADGRRPRRVAGSEVVYATSELNDLFFAPDWHPEDHPPMPPIVARGRAPDVGACGYCHRADGSGGPENADLAGLPRPYIVQQLADFRSGARSSALARRLPQALMISLARTLTEVEIEQAAAYFSSLQPRSRIQVLEAARVPKTYAPGWFLAATGSGGTEPIGSRIIEIPADREQFESRDARARFIAYVPPGSLARGERLVVTGDGGRTPPCGDCHGRDLRGGGVVPPIAGRSPSYVARQLYDLRHGARDGAAAAAMRDVAARLTPEDVLAIAAFLASRPP